MVSSEIVIMRWIMLVMIMFNHIIVLRTDALTGIFCKCFKRMADSMEMTILSVLGPALHCDWGISRYQQALTTTIVFLGMMMSSTFWGQLSDRCGRKPV